MIALSVGLTLSACYVILCRVDKMLKGVTQPIVFAQHFLLAVGLFGAFLLQFTRWEDLSMGSAAAGVIAFFTLSAKRWSRGAPEDTVLGDGHRA